MTRIFHRFFMWKMDPISGFDIRLVLTLPPRDSTLQYKRCVHFWNNFPCLTILGLYCVNFKVSNSWRWWDNEENVARTRNCCNWLSSPHMITHRDSRNFYSPTLAVRCFSEGDRKNRSRRVVAQGPIFIIISIC